jgi:hypothetical protein
VVHLLGPLYHLTEREERLTALGEARRVLRPGGLLAAAGISRFAPDLDEWLDDEERRERLLRIQRVESEPSVIGAPATWSPSAGAPRRSRPCVSANYQNEPVPSVPSASSCSIVFV